MLVLKEHGRLKCSFHLERVTLELKYRSVNEVDGSALTKVCFLPNRLYLAIPP
jgi:hypothetical protein